MRGGLTVMSENRKAPAGTGAIPNAVVYYDSPDIALSPHHLQVCGLALAKLVFGPGFVVARAPVPKPGRFIVGAPSRIRSWRKQDGR
jgi:hypothetical protein